MTETIRKQLYRFRDDCTDYSLIDFKGKTVELERPLKSYLSENVLQTRFQSLIGKFTIVFLFTKKY